MDLLDDMLPIVHLVGLSGNGAHVMSLQQLFFLAATYFNIVRYLVVRHQNTEPAKCARNWCFICTLRRFHIILIFCLIVIGIFIPILLLILNPVVDLACWRAIKDKFSRVFCACRTAMSSCL